MERLEDTIFRSLLYNEEYARKTLPFFKDEYFPQFSDKVVFQEIKKYFNKYSNPPTKEAIIIELGERTDLTDETFQSTTELLKETEKVHEKQLQYYPLVYNHQPHQTDNKVVVMYSLHGLGDLVR